jgi:hypothetical protein
MLIEGQENRLEDIVIHVRDLRDSAPLPNLLLEDSNSKDNDNGSTQPSRGRFVEYIDKACQTDAQSSSNRQVHLAIEYIPIEGQQQILLAESNTQTSTQENSLNSQSTSTQTLAIPTSKKYEK